MTQRIIEYEPVSEEVTSETGHEEEPPSHLQNHQENSDVAKIKQINISKNASKHFRRMSVATGIPIDETNDSCQGFKVSICQSYAGMYRV